MADVKNSAPDVVREAGEIAQQTYEKAERIRKKAEQRQALSQARAQSRHQKQEEKLSKKEQAMAYRQSLQERTRRVRPRVWFSFFTKWFFLGLGLIALSITISVCLVPLLKQSLLFHAVLSVAAGILSTVGIALMVGAVFDFSKNSEAFIRFVSNILSDIVVSKTFLTTLSEKDKEKALSLILKPSDSQIEQYSNINALFTKRIKEMMSMFDTNFKTDVVMNIDVYKEKDNVVYCKTVLTQTIYKIQDSFKPIGLHFEKEGSESCDVYALPPVGKSIKLEGKQSEFVSGGITYTKYTYDIPKECEQYDHLTIKRTMIEPGYPHWVNYYWQSLTPYEGLVCTIRCQGDLTIQDHMIFDNKAYYHVVVSEDKKRMEITSSQWLDTDTGFTVTVSDRTVETPPAATAAESAESGSPDAEAAQS